MIAKLEAAMQSNLPGATFMYSWCQVVERIFRGRLLNILLHHGGIGSISLLPDREGRTLVVFLGFHVVRGKQILKF